MNLSTTKSIARLVCLLMLLLAGKVFAAPTPYPQGKLLDGPVHFVFAIYFVDPPAVVPLDALKRAIKDAGSSIQLVDRLPNQPAGASLVATLDTNVAKDYAPPSLTMIGYFGRGLSHDQAVALQSSTSALVLEFTHPASMSIAGLQQADRVLLETAERTGGFLWDEETREIFTPAEWRKRRLESWQGNAPDMRKHTVIHAYKSEKMVRAISLGMAKFGLPDVVVNDFSWSLNRPVGNLINALAQVSVEGAVVGKDGAMELDLRAIQHDAVRADVLESLLPEAKTVAKLSLAKGQWEDGDPQNRLMAIEFNRYAGVDRYARQEAMLDALFGSFDKVQMVKHTEAILAASHAARSKLPALQAAFRKGLQPGEYLLLKAPFKTATGGREWMWVEVMSWDGEKIQGLLKNEPANIPDLHGGQQVAIAQSDVFDYIRYDANGNAEGNETGKLMQVQNR